MFYTIPLHIILLKIYVRLSIITLYIHTLATTPPNQVVSIDVSTGPYSVKISWITVRIILDRETYRVQYGMNMTLKYDSDSVLGIDNRFVTNERYSINITELTPFTTYYFILWASNSVGNTSTGIMNFTTDQTGT